MTNGVDVQAMRAGIGLAFAFWTALADDDDEVIAAAILPESLAYWGPAHGIAGRIRAHRGIERDECRVLGVHFPVSLLENGLRLYFAHTGPLGRQTVAGEAVIGWTVEVVERDGSMWVDPTPAKVGAVVARLDASGSVIGPEDPEPPPAPVGQMH